MVCVAFFGFSSFHMIFCVVAVFVSTTFHVNNLLWFLFLVSASFRSILAHKFCKAHTAQIVSNQMNLSDDIPLHRYTICGRFIHIFIYRQRLLDIPSFTIFHTNITTNEAVK